MMSKPARSLSVLNIAKGEDDLRPVIHMLKFIKRILYLNMHQYYLMDKKYGDDLDEARQGLLGIVCLRLIQIYLFLVLYVLPLERCLCLQRFFSRLRNIFLGLRYLLQLQYTGIGDSSYR